MAYLQDTWIDGHKEKFIRYWVDHVLYFGNRDTSRAEGAHATIKRYLQISTGDLYSILQKLAQMLENQHIEHNASMAQARNRTPQSFRIPLMEAVVGHITPYALWRVYEQKQILNRPTLHRPCHRSLVDSMGIPCYHIIQERIAQNQILYQHDFHSCWFFNTPPDQFIQTAP